MRLMIPFRLALGVALAAGCGGAATPSASAAPCWPLMTDPQPRGTLPAGTRRTTLTMTTDRDAVCRFATEEGLVYAVMDQVFAITGGTRHSLTVDGLADGGFYRMYAKCEAPVTGCATPHDLIFIFNVESARPQTSLR